MSSQRIPTTDKRRRTPFRSRARQSVESRVMEPEAVDPRASRTTERPRPVRQLESELGNATYNCGCGFIFQSPVLTSVACPHCGDSQAW